MAFGILIISEQEFYLPHTNDAYNQQTGTEGFLCMPKNMNLTFHHTITPKRSNGALSRRIPPQLLTKSRKKTINPFIISNPLIYTVIS